MLIRDSLVYLVVRATSGILNLLSLVIFTNLLTTKDYGIYSFAISIGSSLAAVFFGWLATSYARLHEEKEERTVEITNSILILYLKSIIFCVLAFLLYFLLTKEQESQNITLAISGSIILISILLGYHSIALQKFNSSLKKRNYFYLNTSRLIFSLILGAILSPFGIEYVLLGTAIGILVSITVLSDLKLLDFNLFTTRDKVTEQKIFTFGFPLIIGAITTAVLDNFDKIIIMSFLDWESLAYYSSAYNISQQSTGVILSILYTSSYPHIIKSLSNNDLSLYKNRIKFLGISLLIGAVLINFFFFLFNTEVSTLLFPEKMQLETAKIMPWVSIAIAIGCIKSYFLDLPLLIRKKTWLYTLTIIITAASNIAFNLILIPHFGAIGAAYSSLISFSIGSLISIYYFFENTEKILNRI